MNTERGDWPDRLLSQLVRSIKYSRTSTVWVLTKDEWQIAQQLIEIVATAVLSSPVAILKSSQQAHIYPLLFRSVKEGHFALIFLDDAKCPHLLNFLMHLVAGGRIRYGSNILAFPSTESLTVHDNFYFSLFVDPSDYKHYIEPNIPRGSLGPVFYLT